MHYWWQGTPNGGLLNLRYVVNVYARDREGLSGETVYELVFVTRRYDYVDTYPTAADRDIAFAALTDRLGAAQGV